MRLSPPNCAARTIRRAGFATVALAVAALAAPALGPVEPAAASTLKRSFTVEPGDGLRKLTPAPGERSLVRRAPGVRAKPGRVRRRDSLLFFAQMTDLQVIDEESPARKEYLSYGGDTSWRPQEALTTQAGERLVRAINAHRVSELRTSSRRRARLRMTVITGDQTDNAQLNETRWYLSLMDGGSVDPSSGRIPCDGAPAGYTGVQDYSDYPPQATDDDRLADYWDPDRAGARGRYGDLAYPGLMERAQQPFVATGLEMPWYAALGNHDVARAGIAPGDHPAFDDELATGCRKAFPSDALPPGALGAHSQGQALARLADPDILEQLERDSRPVLADPDRRMVGKRELKAMHGREDSGHGFRLVDRAERRASTGSAAYYAHTPRRGVRVIALDTSAEGGRSNGNLDDPQYRWLARELDRNSSVSFDAKGRLRRDGDRDRLVIVTGHHPFTKLDNNWVDERAPCNGPRAVGCDMDPRSSRPLHLGLTGRRPIVTLLQRYPNVVAYVTGHTHANKVTPYFRDDRRGGFWELVTTGSIDFPGQARLIELMDNNDGTLSVFGTLVNQAAPLEPPPSGTPAAGMTDAQLASLDRVLAGNQTLQRIAAPALGLRRDRNVELLVRDPRRLARRGVKAPRTQR